MVVKTIETGLGVFAKTLEGYLKGVNASRHLDKFGDDLEKHQEAWHSEEKQVSNAYGNSHL